jgi:hypothetical protein
VEPDAPYLAALAVPHSQVAAADCCYWVGAPAVTNNCPSQHRQQCWAAHWAVSSCCCCCRVSGTLAAAAADTSAADASPCCHANRPLLLLLLLQLEVQACASA